MENIRGITFIAALSSAAMPWAAATSIDYVDEVNVVGSPTQICQVSTSWDAYSDAEEMEISEASWLDQEISFWSNPSEELSALKAEVADDLQRALASKTSTESDEDITEWAITLVKSANSQS